MTLEVWFEFASTYSYLSISRVERLAEEASLKLTWRPFLLGPIFRDKGMSTSPFVLDPVKGAYMWRDLERRADRYGLAFKRPALFPANGLYAARIMTAASREAWCGAFARNVFEAQFVRGDDISAPDVLARALTACAVDPSDWMERAQHQGVKDRLRHTTQLASEVGIFGAPSFRVGAELFWGDDRLEDAIACAADRPERER